MTPLPVIMGKGGFELTMVRRQGRAVIYRQHLPGGNPDHDAYEVIMPQSRNTNYKGEPVEPYEAYPAAESWGKKGWTFASLATAVQKLKELAQKASCAGTVSRKNRLDGSEASRAGSYVVASCFVVPRNNFPRPVRQRFDTPAEAAVGIDCPPTT
jgi:hypothetical protein